MSAQRPLFDPSKMAVAKTPASPAAPAAGQQLMTVTHLSTLIKQVLADHLPGTIHLVAQISNCSKHSSGHLYLTLKDERSEIRAVMWRSALSALKFKPADGMEVVATGYVDVYENRGQYQFYINRLEPRGVGALELAFRQLREKLQKEGLFEPARKRPIPRFPRCIAIVTSPTGAAIRDVLRALSRRCRSVSVLIYPVRVQGEGAAAEIAAAIQRINQQRAAFGRIDTLIVARGGGSLEDLWAFNEEVVARAIVESTIPVISGVGHEVDVTIADLVADLRAATPTATAEQAVPVLDEVLATLSAHAERLRRAVRHRHDLLSARLQRAESTEWFRSPVAVLQRREQQLDEIESRLRLACTNALHRARQRLHQLEVRCTGAHPRLWARQREQIERIDHKLQWVMSQRLRHLERRIEGSAGRLEARAPQHTLPALADRINQWERHLQRAAGHRVQTVIQELSSFAARLESTSHKSTLARGFTITRNRRGQIITRPQDVHPGDRINTQTADGSIESRVTDATQPELFE